MAISNIDQIRKTLADSKYVFIISGLGGNIGSGLSPFLAKVAKESKAVVVSIVAMPFKFEKNKHFYAGVALRQIRKLSDAVIIIDNESLLESAPKESMLNVYALVNEKISTALNKLIEPPQGREVGVGLKKFVETINREGYAILSVCESFKAAEEAVAGASRSMHQIAEPDQARNAILCIMSNGNVSTEDVATSVSRLGSLFGNGSAEIQYGISMSNRRGLTAILLTSGFRDTKFSDYDPVTKILHGFEVDEDLDTSLNVKLPRISDLEEF
jgi:cell division GTPase FtsZ